MATDILLIRNKAQLWNNFVMKSLRGGLSEAVIHDLLCEEFRRELFVQMMFRLKVDDLANVEPTEKNIQTVRNIMGETGKKWLSLVRQCERYEETKNLLSRDDLKRVRNDIILGSINGGNDHDDGNEHPSAKSADGDQESEKENNVLQQVREDAEEDIPFAEPPVGV